MLCNFELTIMIIQVNVQNIDEIYERYDEYSLALQSKEVTANISWGKTF